MATVVKDSEGLVYFRSHIHGTTYSFSLDDVTEEGQQWLADMIEMNLKESYERGFRAGAHDTQTQIRKALGL